MNGWFFKEEISIKVDTPTTAVSTYSTTPACIFSLIYVCNQMTKKLI